LQESIARRSVPSPACPNAFSTSARSHVDRLQSDWPRNHHGELSRSTSSASVPPCYLLRQLLARHAGMPPVLSHSSRTMPEGLNSGIRAVPPAQHVMRIPQVPYNSVSRRSPEFLRPRFGFRFATRWPMLLVETSCGIRRSSARMHEPINLKQRAVAPEVEPEATDALRKAMILAIVLLHSGSTIARSSFR